MKLETENNNMSKEKNVETVQVDLNGFEDNTNPVAVPGKIAKAAKKSKVNIPEKSEPVVENDGKTTTCQQYCTYPKHIYQHFHHWWLSFYSSIVIKANRKYRIIYYHRHSC